MQYDAVYLVVQHGEWGEALQDARLKEIREDPHHGQVRVTALCAQKHMDVGFKHWTGV